MNNSSAKSDFVFKEGVPLVLHKIDVFDEKVIVFGHKKIIIQIVVEAASMQYVFPYFLTLSSSIKQ